MKLPLIALSLGIVVCVLIAHVWAEESAAQLTSPSLRAIEDAWPALKRETTAAAKLDVLQTTANTVLRESPHNHLITTKLQTALTKASEATPEKTVKLLQAALQDSEDILRFRITREAKLPIGFPEPTPLGEIRQKEYPAYRLARAASKKDSAFFTLFGHIQKNKIEMTAPVEVRYDETNSKYEQIDMAFLYGEPDWGKVGDAGKGVTVEDIPALTTISIGLSGDYETDLIPYVDALETWLAKNAPDHERDGKVRMMGYNSPFVFKSKRYFEVEIPVKKRM